ncbi:Transmembrane transcriptional regulator (anti-sigma factor RsiW) [Thalassobacillus cyri]|uniref:Anti-sigma-W factor RsiW n=1 Tax=Thalassobacillus cyri TaxID=571932 RepID=A0A1H4EE60_9BACI|nr:anti-sigma factor [Thalassobacillus cyri]SEA83236.1 Transmembrane transcriptional regulator (anti-sigma factor RsiW) [Thalassobacillus cyri]
MNCKQEVIALMHKYLDDDLTQPEEKKLRFHLQSCSDCQAHFHELKRTISLVKSSSPISAPGDFTANVMSNLPQQKKRNHYMRWFRNHPFFTAAAVFFLMMFGGVFSAWTEDQQVTVSKQENLVIQNQVVIVPEDVTVEGDLVVRNGDLRIDGAVNGDVTIINGDILEQDSVQDSPLEGEKYMAYVSGEVNEVNQVFEWMWYHTKKTLEGVFSLGNGE